MFSLNRPRGRFSLVVAMSVYISIYIYIYLYVPFSCNFFKVMKSKVFSIIYWLVSYYYNMQRWQVTPLDIMFVYLPLRCRWDPQGVATPWALPRGPPRVLGPLWAPSRPLSRGLPIGHSPRNTPPSPVFCWVICNSRGGVVKVYIGYPSRFLLIFS